MYDTMEALRRECLNCQKCPLAQTRTNVVFGVGVEDAEVLLIGEGPGEQEDLRGEPFVGRGGQLLEKYLAAIDLSREKKHLYREYGKNAGPPKTAILCRKKWKHACLICAIRLRFCVPKSLYAWVGLPRKKLISPNFRVTKEHGQWFQRNGVWMMGTYHPASLLRNPQQKPEALEDFIALREKIWEVCPETYEDTAAFSDEKG